MRFEGLEPLCRWFVAGGLAATQYTPYVRRMNIWVRENHLAWLSPTTSLTDLTVDTEAMLTGSTAPAAEKWERRAEELCGRELSALARSAVRILWQALSGFSDVQRLAFCTIQPSNSGNARLGRYASSRRNAIGSLTSSQNLPITPVQPILKCPGELQLVLEMIFNAMGDLKGLEIDMYADLPIRLDILAVNGHLRNIEKLTTGWWFGMTAQDAARTFGGLTKLKTLTWSTGGWYDPDRHAPPEPFLTAESIRCLPPGLESLHFDGDKPSPQRFLTRPTGAILALGDAACAASLRHLAFTSDDDREPVDPAALDEIMQALPRLGGLEYVGLHFRLPGDARRVLESEVRNCLAPHVHGRCRVRMCLRYEDRRFTSNHIEYYAEMEESRRRLAQ